MSTSADLVLSMLTLHRDGRTGVATIRNEGLTTFVYFRHGVLVFAEEGTHAELLAKNGRYAALVELQKTMG